MAITSGMCRSFKKECLQGIHDFSADTIKVALFTSAATLSPDTTAYATTNEATGTGWSAGGIALPVTSGYPAVDAGSGFGVVRFDDTNALDVTVTFRAVLIYNASKANRAIMVLDRGIDVVITAGPIDFLTNHVSPYLIVIA